jgi:hypothetical protein
MLRGSPVERASPASRRSRPRARSSAGNPARIACRTALWRAKVHLCVHPAGRRAFSARVRLVEWPVRPAPGPRLVLDWPPGASAARGVASWSGRSLAPAVELATPRARARCIQPPPFRSSGSKHPAARSQTRARDASRLARRARQPGIPSFTPASTQSCQSSEPLYLPDCALAARKVCALPISRTRRSWSHEPQRRRAAGSSCTIVRGLEPVASTTLRPWLTTMPAM